MSRYIFKQILIGVGNIHSRNVIHRDLKLENILLDGSYAVAIADFGNAYILDEGQDGCVIGSCGTPIYMSPENLASRASAYCGFKADIWSLGCILFVMLMGMTPFEEEGPIPTDWFLKRLETRQQDEFWSRHESAIYSTKKISDEAKAFIGRMLAFEPQERPSVADLLCDPWLRNDQMPLNEAKATLRLMTIDIIKVKADIKMKEDIKRLERLTSSGIYPTNDKGSCA